MPTNTSYGTEVREDGTQGRVMSKSCGDHDAVYREGDPVGDPFICTWQGEKVYILDKAMPPAKREFNLTDTGYANFLSNSVFVGDGFMAGLVTTASDTAVKNNDPATIAVLLMRVPRPGKAMTVAEFEAAEDADKNKASIVLPGITLTRLREVYVVPMGWKDKVNRFMFAVVATASISTGESSMAQPSLPTVSTYAEAPLIWVFSTGPFVSAPREEGDGPSFGVYGPVAMPAPPSIDFGMTGVLDEKLQAALGVSPKLTDSASFGDPFGRVSAVCSEITSTGRGRLEFIVYKPESNSNHDVPGGDAGQHPLMVLWGGAPSALSPFPGGWAAAPTIVQSYVPTFPGFGPNWYGPGLWYYAPTEAVPTALATTTTVTVEVTQAEYVPRSASMFLATTEDFGATWTLTHQPGLEASSYASAWGKGATSHAINYEDYFPGYSIPDSPESGWWTSRKALLYGVETVKRTDVHAYIYGTTGSEIFWDYSVYSSTIKRTDDIIPWPATSANSNRGLVVRNSGLSAHIVAAGNTTFLATVGTEPQGTVYGPTRYAYDFIGTQTNPDTGAYQAEDHPYTVTGELLSAPSIMQVYRRTGGGGFTRIAWPLDNAATLRSYVRDARAREARSVAMETSEGYRQASERAAQPHTGSWASTGEGAAAFFVTPEPTYTHGSADPLPNSVLMVATRDGGENWTVLELPTADLFYQTCVIRDDGKGASILYAVPAPKDKLQLMRISADFTKVSKYGPPYTPGRRGLVNFQKYIHPGFPGLYEEPKETT